MTEEELKNLPILGNLQEWGNYESDPVSSTELQDELSDLPY